MPPSPATPANTVPPSETTYNWNESYTLEVTEAEASAAGPPVGFSQGRNCVVLLVDGGAPRIRGQLVASWTAVGPNTQELQLAVDIDDRGSNFRRVAEVTGSSPLELLLPEFAAEERVSIYLGAPPGVHLAAKQEADLTVSLEYESASKATTEMSTCGATGA